MSRRTGALHGRTASKLLLAGMLLDILLLLLLTRMISSQQLMSALAQFFDGAAASLKFISVFSMAMNNGFGELVVFGVLLIANALLTELVLGGRTFGRWVLGLSLHDKSGQPATRGQRVNRAARKFSTLGLGTRGTKSAQHDKASGCVWHSGMAQAKAAPVAMWRLSMQMRTGQKRSITFGSISRFTQSKTIRIGRDANWADVILPSESSASGKHCFIRVRGSVLDIADNASKNGTFVSGKRISPKTWTQLPRNTVFKMSDVAAKVET